MSGWGGELAEIWTNNVPPSRPSCSELCVYTTFLRKLQKKTTRQLKLLVLGSTPEFRDWGYEENLCVSVVDKSEEYYKHISRELRHKNTKESVFFSTWEAMQLPESYDIILGDLAIGNIDPRKFDTFLRNIRDSLSDDGIFMGKSFIWTDKETVKSPKQIIDEYSNFIQIHPYTFINHQLGLFCLDKLRFSIDFRRMFLELENLVSHGDMSHELFSYFKNVGWNTEMKFEFFAPSQEFFVSSVNKVLAFNQFVHTEDVYTNVFPIYVINQKTSEVTL